MIGYPRSLHLRERQPSPQQRVGKNCSTSQTSSPRSSYPLRSFVRTARRQPSLVRLRETRMVRQAHTNRGCVPNEVEIGGLGRGVLLDRLRAEGIQLNDAAEALFADRRFETGSRTEVIAIVSVSVAELGFDEGATYRQLTARALESGLAECPLELGPHLRMQFLDQL